MKHEAVYALYSNVVKIVKDIPYDKDGNVVVIDEQLINAWVDPNQYVYTRQLKYPTIGDQLDMLWHAIDNGTLNKTSDFYTAIKAVKDAHPKE